MTPNHKVNKFQLGRSWTTVSGQPTCYLTGELLLEHARAREQGRGRGEWGGGGGPSIYKEERPGSLWSLQSGTWILGCHLSERWQLNLKFQWCGLGSWGGICVQKWCQELWSPKIGQWLSVQWWGMTPSSSHWGLSCHILQGSPRCHTLIWNAQASDYREICIRESGQKPFHWGAKGFVCWFRSTPKGRWCLWCL